MKDVINQNWLSAKTVGTRNDIAWGKPFAGWPLFLSIAVLLASYMLISQNIDGEPMGAFVFSLMMAIGVAAFSLRWRRIVVGKSREMNRRQQVYLQDYKDSLKEELLKKIPSEDRDLLERQLEHIRGLIEITENKFHDNIVGSRVFVDDEPRHPKDDEHPHDRTANWRGTVNANTVGQNGRLTDTTPTGA